MINSDIKRKRIQKKIIGQIRRALDDFNMISVGDKIAVGVSGGKDSLALLIGLHTLQKYYPAKFDLIAITLDLGIGNPDFGGIADLCGKLGIEYIIEHTDIGKIVFEGSLESGHCSFCANLRRGALNNAALAAGSNKVALGHNNNDCVETLLLSMFYEGRMHTFSPVTYLSRKNITVIRPLIYSTAADIKGYIAHSPVSVVNNPCPVKDDTKRTFIRNQLELLRKDIPFIHENIFGGIKRSSLDGWKNIDSKDDLQ